MENKRAIKIDLLFVPQQPYKKKKILIQSPTCFAKARTLAVPRVFMLTAVFSDRSNRTLAAMLITTETFFKLSTSAEEIPSPSDVVSPDTTTSFFSLSG